MIGFVVHSRMSVKDWSRVVRSTASMSGFPFEVESVKEDDHIPSNVWRPSSFITSVFSTMRPESPECASIMRTMGFAAIRRRSVARRMSGVVPIDFALSARAVELIPCV